MPARYDEIGQGYRRTRRTEPRIEAQIRTALGSAESVVNVGAGTGSYEPPDRRVVAIEPSVTMIGQRPLGSAPSVRAVAEAMPFSDNRFDAAMAVLTLHHWTSLAEGLRELRRVSSRQVVLLFEPAKDTAFWLATEYLPFWLDMDADLPTVADVESHLDVRSVDVVPVPADCLDGFGGAYWNRPERYLDPTVQSGISSFAAFPELVAPGMERLRDDLRSGRWDARHGQLRGLTELDLGYRLISAG